MKVPSEFLTMTEYNIELLPISECLKESEFSMEPDIIDPSEDQMKLLAYIITSSSKNLQELLAKRKININYYYEKPYKKTALEILCSEYPTDANIKCVELLIAHGANAEQALEAAVQGGNAKILKLLLDQTEKEQVDMYEKKLIITLIKHIESTGKNEADYVEVLKLLLKTGIDMNAIDSNGCTGVYLAAKYKFEKLIQVFLTYSDINLDILPIKAKRTARELITRNDLYTGKLPINSKQTSSNRSILDENIRQKQQTLFIKNYSNMKSNLMQTENYPYQIDLRYSYLCEASESGLDSIVQYLLCDGVDIDTEEEISESPLYLATMNGYYKVVKTLLEYSSTLTVSHTFVRMLALRKMDSETATNISYRQCFNYYLESKHLDINYCLSDKDRKLEGKTALYFAIKNQNEEIVIMILRKGASLVYLYPWEVFLDAKTLIKYLNESIMPQESKPITKIQITALLPSEKDEEEPETKVLKYFCKTPELHPVLHHPVIQILLSLKWKTVRTFYDINLIVFLMFSVSMMLYVILVYNNAKELCPGAVEICLFLIVVSYIILIFRELLQVYIFRKEYFTNYENYIEIGILSITAKILTLDPTERKPFNRYAAILIVLTATESLLLIGRQSPLLFISITVLKTVSRTLIKWLFPYFLIVIAFSSSFFLLFKKDCNTDTIPPCSDDEKHFSDFYKSFVRTAVMLTGEFEVGNLNFDIYPETSPFVFIIYVFWMNTVLFGVCTALAFGETQILMKNAQVRKEIYRIEHIAHWETVLRKNKTIQNFLKVEKLFQKNSLIIEMTKGSKVYILNNPDPYKKLKSYLPHCMHRGIEVVCRDDLPYIIYLEKKVVKDIASLIDEQKQKKKALKF